MGVADLIPALMLWVNTLPTEPSSQFPPGSLLSGIRVCTSFGVPFILQQKLHAEGSLALQGQSEHVIGTDPPDAGKACVPREKGSSALQQAAMGGWVDTS